ncbi:restriction endonuclease subunit S [Streptomyces sp. NPDC058766]|uniref:restriction endonuclease subunit S n=1 Tax=Streptomyces sp. NPDC058766 TaxID=3346630 RepID=UPI003693D36F
MSAEPTMSVPLDYYLAGPPRNGYSPVESADWTGVQMLGLGCLTPGGFVPRQLKNAPNGITAKHPAILRQGDLLMSRANTRDLVGLVGRYRDVGSFCIYPDLMMRLEPAKNCLPEFLEIVLRSPAVRRSLSSRAQGTSESMVKISAESVRSLQVPLLSLVAQRRIVEALESVIESERAAVASLAKLRKIRVAAWDSFERDKATAWPLLRITDVARLPTGQVDPRHAPYRYQQLLAPDHVEPTAGRITARVTAETQNAISGKYIVRPGYVVLSKIRPALRKVVVADFTGTCSADMYPLCPTGEILADYLCAALLGSRFSRFSENVSGRTGIPKLNRNDLSEYSLRVPPLLEQKKIVQVLARIGEHERLEEERMAKIAAFKVAIVGEMLGEE